MGSKEYRKIKDIARQQIETTLKDKRALLLIALVAVIEAFKLDPEKQYTFPTYQPMAQPTILYGANGKKNYWKLLNRFIVELANDLMNATMNSTFDKQVIVPFP